MRCQHATQLISHAMDESLSEFDRARLGEHLETCVECLTHQDVLQRGRELLQRAEVQPSDNFEWKVQLGIQKALRQRASSAAIPQARGRFWLPVTATAAVALVAVVAVGLLALPPSASEPALDLAGAERVTLPELPSFGRADVVPVSTGPGWRASSNDRLPGAMQLLMENQLLQAENVHLRRVIAQLHSARRHDSEATVDSSRENTSADPR